MSQAEESTCPTPIKIMSASSNIPRKDSKTEEQAQIDMGKMLQEYLIDDAVANDFRHKTPSKPTAKAKAKKPIKKSPKAAPKQTKKSADGDSPPTRKSARMQAKRKESDDAVESEVEAKRLKPTPSYAGVSSFLKRKAPDNTGEDDVEHVAPAKRQKNTGRFTPINSQLKRAKKIDVKSIPQASSSQVEQEIDEAIEASDVEETDTPAPKGKGKAKKSAPAFKGTTNGMGTSVEKPEDATIDEPWKCANRNCSSGQTHHPRDGPQSYGRKTVSNFFGRNKKETNLIHPDVWHNYCRKDYQRGTYRANIQSPKAKCQYYIDNINMQLVRIKLWRPEATFRVQLSKGAKERLGKYYKELNKNGNDTEKATKALDKGKKTNGKGKEKPLSLEDAFPVECLKYFDDNFAAEDQRFDDIDTIVVWTQSLVDAGSIESMPPMEFLINELAEVEEVIDPKYNYERWAAHEDDQDFVTPDGSVADNEEKPEVADDVETIEESTEEADRGDETRAEATDSKPTLEQIDDGEETEDAELTADDSETTPEPDIPATPTPPQKKRYKLTPTVKGATVGPFSSTYGAMPGSGINKRKRSYSDDEDGDVAGSTPSKVQKL